jgi:hypothetical protein
MNKILLTLAGLLLSTNLFAATVNNNCTLAWDYDPAQIQYVDEFVVYVNNVEAYAVPASEQVAACSPLGLETGMYTFEVTARNAAGESARSNSVDAIFVTTAPDAPSQLRVKVNVNVVVN